MLNSREQQHSRRAVESLTGPNIPTHTVQAKQSQPVGLMDQDPTARLEAQCPALQRTPPEKCDLSFL